MSLLVANGQLASSQTTLATATITDLWSIRMRNTSASTPQVVVLEVLRNGGTARTLPSTTIPVHGGSVIGPIPVESGDVLKATTTSATTVDYDLTGVGTNPTPAACAVQTDVQTWDQYGNIQTGTTGATITATTAAVDRKLSLSPQPTDTFAATMTIDVSYSGHIISVSETTSGTCTMTPSGTGSAGDLLFIVQEADSSGTVTTTYASTFHSSGTQATTASHKSTIGFISDGTIWVEAFRTTAVS